MNETIEIPRGNFHHMTAELLYYKYYKSNRDQAKGIERKNRQLRALKSRLHDYETLRRWVKKYTKRHMSETDMVDFLSRTVKFYTAHAQSELWFPPKPAADVSTDPPPSVSSDQPPTQ